MFANPYLASGIVRERQRDLLAQADQWRKVRQLRNLARASRRADRAERRTSRALKRSRTASLPS